MCYRGTGPGPAGSDTMSLATFADSMNVLRELDRAVRSRPHDATLWYRRAMVAWALASSPPERAKDYVVEYTRLRQTADLSFQAATQLRPPAIEHFLMAGKYYLTSTWANTRATSYGYFREALKLARESGDGTEIARTALETARIYWRWYEGWGGNRDGADFLRAAVLLREAYEADPDNPEAYHYLAMVLADGDRWHELEALARERLTRLPRDGWTWMTIGLARQRLRDGKHAEAVFDTAMALLDPRERARLDRFERLQSRDDSAAFARETPEERARREAQAWSHADPLWSEDEEAPRTEFLARLTFAELRWTSPDRGVRGADTDRGNVYVRYGPPRLVAFEGTADPDGDRGAQFSGADVQGASRASGRDASIGPGASPGRLAPAPKEGSGVGGHTASYWAYPGVAFGFLGMRTFGVSCFDDRDRALARIDSTPARWDNIALARIDSMQSQVARFRATADSVDVFIAAFAPFERIREAVGVNAPVESRLWIYGLDTRDSLTTSIGVPFNAEVRWTPRVSSGRYYYRVETTIEGGLAAGRVASTMHMGPDSITGFATRGFGISDVLLADSARETSVARRWTDLDVVPIFDGRATLGELSLVWENYDFANAGGLARYQVAIHLERADQRAPGVAGRIAAQIVGGVANLIGIQRRDEPNRVVFEFEREVAHRSTLLDHVTLSLGDTEPGPYTLTVVVTDRVSGRVASRSLPISIRE